MTVAGDSAMMGVRRGRAKHTIIRGGARRPQGREPVQRHRHPGNFPLPRRSAARQSAIPALPPMSATPPEPEIPADAPPPVAPWVSTQHEMETAARPSRTRVFRLRMKSGHVRIAAVTYFHARCDQRHRHPRRAPLPRATELAGRVRPARRQDPALRRTHLHQPPRQCAAVPRAGDDHRRRQAPRRRPARARRARSWPTRRAWGS